MNILITTPSLKMEDNVSGISSMSRLLMQYNTKEAYFPFILGRKDNVKRGIAWLFTQFKIPFRLLLFIKKNKINAAHFNIGFEPPSLLRDIIPYMILSWTKMPLYLHIHGGRYMAAVPGNWVLKNIIVLLLKRASVVVVLSNSELEYLQLNYCFLKNTQVRVLSNAVEVPKITDVRKNYNDVLRILYLGRIDRKKGLKIIAETLNRLTEQQIPFCFYLCGVGTDKDLFMSWLKEETRASVIDKGLVAGVVKNELLDESHLFLLPSLFEGLPMALLESMGHAVVPLVTKVGSIPNVVKEEENGLFVSDADSIVAAVSLLNRDRNMLRSLSYSAHETIQRQYCITKYVDMVNAIYSEV